MVKARIAEQDNAANRRRSERHDVGIAAQLREMGQEGTEVEVLNLSDHGFMAECPDLDIDTGARVWLIFPDGTRASAQVRWTAGGKLGAEFLEPIEASKQIAS